MSDVAHQGLKVSGPLLWVLILTEARVLRREEGLVERMQRHHIVKLKRLSLDYVPNSSSTEL